MRATIFFLMLQQLCCGFVLQDLENPFTRGDFNSLADRVGLLGCNQGVVPFQITVRVQL